MSAASSIGYVNEPSAWYNSSAGSPSTSSISSPRDHLRRVAIDELLELRRLGSNWDGEGAAAPKPELVDTAIKFIAKNDAIDPPTRIVPVNDGRVTLEWDTADEFRSIRVESQKQLRQMIVRRDGKTEFRLINL